MNYTNILKRYNRICQLINDLNLEEEALHEQMRAMEKEFDIARPYPKTIIEWEAEHKRLHDLLLQHTDKKARALLNKSMKRANERIVYLKMTPEEQAEYDAKEIERLMKFLDDIAKLREENETD